jgi:hypothetical protein
MGRPLGHISRRTLRLSRLARSIYKDLAYEYIATTPWARRRLERAARLLALSEQVMSQIGLDPKSTTRRTTALESTAQRHLAALEASGRRHLARFMREE